MGCSNCKSRGEQRRILEENVLNCIRIDNAKGLCKVFKSLANFEVNETCANFAFVEYDDMVLTPLSYCLVLGSSNCYKVLVKKYKGNVALMERNLTSYGLSAINYLCETGNLDMLKAYLLNYLSNHSLYAERSPRKLSQDHLLPLESTTHSSPLHTAIIKGHIPIVKHLLDINSIINSPKLKVPYTDQVTGENSALVSIRSSSFPMVKLLFESYEADFTLKNHKNESAYKILAEETLKKFSYTQLEILVYLVEVIKVPLHESDESILKTLKSRPMILYLLSKFNKPLKNPSKDSKSFYFDCSEESLQTESQFGQVSDDSERNISSMLKLLTN